MKKIMQSIVNLTTGAIVSNKVYVVMPIDLHYQPDVVKKIDKCQVPVLKPVGQKPSICCHCNQFLTCLDHCEKITALPGDILHIKGFVKNSEGLLITAIDDQTIPLELGWLVAYIEKGIFSFHEPQLSN